MMPLFEELRSLAEDHDKIRRRRYGTIEIVAGRLTRIRFSPVPRLLSIPDVGWLRNPFHKRARGDRCLVYFSQPLGSPRYLAIRHVVSTRDCQYASVRRAAQVLDELARIKESDAIVCDVVNFRISSRLLRRWGWEPLREKWWHRFWIKRFYGAYPPSPDWLVGSEVQQVKPEQHADLVLA